MDTAPSARTADTVRAELVYTVKTAEKPSTGATPTGESLEWRRGDRQSHFFDIHNGRPLAGELSLEREGFQLVDHTTRVKDFYDEEEVRFVYYPEIEALIKKHTGATTVHIFDHTVRNADEGERESKGVRAPVLAVHNDYTDWSGPQRVRDLFAEAEAEALLEHRLAVIQVWRPIGATVKQAPLAICDARSISPDDMIAADRKYPDRVGEIYQYAFNAAHNWFYFPDMRRDEAVIFKCYESRTDGRARFTAHTAFEDPTAPEDAPPRESIEIRCLVFWEGEPANG